MLRRSLSIVLLLAFMTLLMGPATGEAAELTDEQRAKRVDQLFDRENLVAWCVVPFDAKRRGPEERTVMLRALGLEQLAYDWRAEDVPHFDTEMEMLKKYDVELTGFWHFGGLDANARTILDLLERHEIETTLWVLIGEPEGETDAEKVGKAADTLRPLAEAADAIGCSIGLYNHGGWFGEPRNQVRIIETMDMDNVGIVYNQHHGHHHVDEFAELLELMMPHLICLNLNGMMPDGDQHGQKIWPLGHGELDLELLNVIVESDYDGPIGVLGHTMDDVEQRLLDNLAGLEWLKPQLKGESAGERPTTRTQ
ncbi:MAG: TIM barrel protein [Phycisphaeraceae bacterium]